MAYFALLLLPVAAGIIPSVSQSEAVPPPRLESTTTTVNLTRLGKHKQITLPDGSRVNLNSDCRILITFPPEGRPIDQESWNRRRAAKAFPRLTWTHL